MALPRPAAVVRTLGLAYCLFVALLFPACTSARISRETSPVAQLPSPPPSPAARTVTATPPQDPASLIAEAYQDLLANLFLSVTPEQLLGGAWSGAGMEARAEGVSALPAPPDLGPDAQTDLDSFDQSYAALVQRGGRLDLQRLSQAAITSMAESVDDCHTAYLSKGAWQSVQADLEGQSAIGSLPLEFQLAAPYLITSVVAGSDAASAGIHAGDRLVAFDETPIDQIPLSQRKFLVAGAPGSAATLTLASPDGAQRTVTLQRTLVQRPLLSTQLDGNVGYIKLRTFSENLNPLIDRAMSSLSAEGAKGFVVDLRGNLGGELNADVHLLSHFIASGQLAVLTRPGVAEQAIRTDGSVLPGSPPLAVLVDGGSLSASELFASDIKQYQAGELVGTPTPGCLVASEFQQLRDGSAVQISVDNVLAGPGRVEVNKAGVQPDVLVPISAADLAAGRDPQRDRAIADVAARIK